MAGNELGVAVGGRRGGDGALGGVGASGRAARQPPAPPDRAPPPLSRLRAARGRRSQGRRRARRGASRGAPPLRRWTGARRSGRWRASARGTCCRADFFHEVAFDFLLDDGTDEPIWIEVAGGMLLDPLPGRAAHAVPQHDAAGDRASVPHAPAPRRPRGAARPRSTSPPATSSRSWAACRAVSIRRAPSESGRAPPQRRALRSGTRVPVMVRKVTEPDLDLSRVRRLLPKGPPDTTPGEPPMRRF